MSKPILPEAVSIKKVAEVLEVNPMTVRRWIRMRYIVAYRVGPRLIRIPRTEIARMRSIRSDSEGYTKYPVVL